MNKIQLIELLAQKLDITKRSASEIVECTFGTIIDYLKRDENINIGGFGEFKVKQRASRMGINPQTGEKLQIPVSTLPSFRASKALKDLFK